MVATPSTMLRLGTKAPVFKLPETNTSRMRALSWNQGTPGYLIVFVCNHCPYVLHLLDPLTRLAHEWMDCGVEVFFISSNDSSSFPQDSPDKMAELSKKRGFRFPYLFDDDQRVAKSYRAACTPDFFLFDDELLLYYRGQFDGSRPSNGLHPSGIDLRQAVEGLLSNQPPPENQKPSLGCNLKWKPGNEPSYFKKAKT